MPSKKFFIFAIVLISIVLLYSGAFIDKKFSNINSNTGKASVGEIIYKENNQIINPDETILMDKNIKLPEYTEPIPFQQEEEENVIQTPTKKKTPTFACPAPKKEYEDMWLLNVGQNTSLPDETYIPKNLTIVKNPFVSQGSICLIEDAKNNLEAMITKAKADGVNIKVSSGWRSYNTQQDLLDKAINNGNLNANTSIAKAGYSEHQLGTTVDITGESIGYTSAAKSFDGTVEADWLETNGSDYGFIRSYPFGKENITGYIYEPWHYRYVGIDNAKKIKKNEQTITEFLK